MIDLQKLRTFIKDKTDFSLDDIFVGRFYDDEPEKILLTFVSSNSQDITFNGNDVAYGELTLSLKYNGSVNYKKSFEKANDIFKIFKDNPSDKENNIMLYKPQQPTLIGKIKDIYKFEIIVNIKFNY